MPNCRPSLTALVGGVPHSSRLPSHAQLAFGDRDPLGLRLPYVFRCALRLFQHLGEHRTRIGAMPEYGEKQSVPHARFGARIILRKRIVLFQCFLRAAAVLERPPIEEMGIGGLIVRATLAQVLEGRNDFIRTLQTEQSARLPNSVDRVIAERASDWRPALSQ